MAPPDVRLVAALAEKFFLWQRPGDIPRLQEVLQSYRGKEAALLADLEAESLGTQGWSDVRLAADHFYAISDEQPSEDIDAYIQAWHKKHASRLPKPGKDGTLPPGRCFNALYDELDAKFGTTYFSLRRSITAEHDSHEGGMELQERKLGMTQNMLSGVTLSPSGDPQGMNEALEEVKKGYAAERSAYEDWLTRFFTKHKPELIQSIPGMLDAKAGQGGAARNIMKAELFRLHDQETYLKTATWSPGHPEGWGIREALSEYFAHRDPAKEHLVDTILLSISPQDIVDTLMQSEASYLEIYKKRRGTKQPSLFPPWRNQDFPDASRPGGAPPPVATPEFPLKYAQPVLGSLSAAEYPAVEVGKAKKKKKKAEAEAEAAGGGGGERSPPGSPPGEQPGKPAVEEQPQPQEQPQQPSPGVGGPVPAAGRVSPSPALPPAAVRSGSVGSARSGLGARAAVQPPPPLEPPSAPHSVQSRSPRVVVSEEVPLGIEPDEGSPAAPTSPTELVDKSIVLSQAVVNDMNAGGGRGGGGGSVSQSPGQSPEMAPSCAESVGSQSQRRASRSSSSSLFQRLKEKLGKGGGGGGGGSGLSRAPSVHRSEMSAASPPMSPSSAVAVASPANRTLPQMTLMQGDASQQRHDREGRRTMEDPANALIVVANFGGPQGVYYLGKEEWEEVDMPYWVQSDGEKCIYMGRNGRWMIGKRAGIKGKKVWAMSSTPNSGDPPDEVDWLSKPCGWKVDSSMTVTVVPEGELEVDTENRPPVVMARCDRCAALELELDQERGRSEKAWRTVQGDRDRVTELESRLKFAEQAAEKTMRREAEIPFLEDERKHLAKQLEEERSRADSMQDQLQYLRNRELTRDDIGDELRATMLSRTNHSLDIAKRQVSRMRDVLAQVSSFDHKGSDPGALATLIGSLLVNIEGDAARARSEACEGGLDAEMARLRHELRSHELHHGTPPRGMIAAARDAGGAEEDTAALKRRIEELQTEAAQAPLRQAELQVYIGDLQRTLSERDTVVTYLRESADQRAQQVHTLQIQLDAAHAAMGLVRRNGAASRTPSPLGVRDDPALRQRLPPPLMPQPGAL